MYNGNMALVHRGFREDPALRALAGAVGVLLLLVNIGRRALARTPAKTAKIAVADRDRTAPALHGVHGGVGLTAEDRAFIAAFEAGSLPAESFRHHDHVRLAWLYLRRQPLLPAIGAFRDALRRFTRVHGQARRYHETMTWAHMCLIHERMARGGRDQSWDEFVAANTDLFDRRAPILKRYYTDATLESDLAREVFVLPDRRD